MADLEMRETMWAEMKPDCYDGEECDQIKPVWSAYADGDKEGEDAVGDLELLANNFPPGTKVVISEPCCPKCDEPRWPNLPKQDGIPLYSGPCGCGFDWDEWVLNQYS